MMDTYRELIDALSETPAELQEALAGYQPPAERSNESWGPIEYVAHLVDIEKLQRGRMQEILSREGAYLRSYDQERAAVEHDYASRSLDDALTQFATERGETMSLLMNLALKDWEKTGIHDERGELSIEDIAEILISHDAEHLADVRAALAR